MSKIALEEISTKDPHQAEKGDVVKGPGGVFVKIKDFIDDKVVKGQIEYSPDDSDEGECELHLDDCECAMSPHQFGQAKRFAGKGTGFSKNGRKLKYPRNDLFDSKQHDIHSVRVEAFLDGELEAKDLVQEQTKDQVLNVLKRGLPKAIEDVDAGFGKAIEEGRVDDELMTYLEEYKSLAGRYDCEEALDKSLTTLEIEMNNLQVLPAPKAIESIKEWLRKNLTDVWCP